MRAAVLSGLLLSGCGGAAHPATTTSGAGATTTRGTTADTTPPGYTTATAPLPAAVTQPPATSGRSQPSPPSASGARIPATFRIGSGGQGTPPTVNAPALIPVALTLISGDGKAHVALVRTPTPHTLQVPAGGRAELLLPGLRNGRYAIVLDHGAGTLSLVVGGQPGP